MLRHMGPNEKLIVRRENRIASMWLRNFFNCTARLWKRQRFRERRTKEEEADPTSWHQFLNYVIRYLAHMLKRFVSTYNQFQSFVGRNARQFRDGEHETRTEKGFCDAEPHRLLPLCCHFPVQFGGRRHSSLQLRRLPAKRSATAGKAFPHQGRADPPITCIDDVNAIAWEQRGEEGFAPAESSQADRLRRRSLAFPHRRQFHFQRRDFD